MQQYGDFDNLAEKVAIQLNDTHPAIARRRADAPARRRARADVGRGLGASTTRHLQLHQPHAAARGAGDLAGAAVRAAAAAAHADHLRDQRAASRRAARERPRADDGCRSARQPDRRARRAAGADGQPRLRRRRTRSTASSALHTELHEADGVPRPAPHLPDRINNKTNGITPRRWLLQCEPGADRAASSTTIGAGVPRRHRGAARPRAARRRRRVPGRASPA